MEKIRKITKEMTIREVLNGHPRAAFVFIDYWLHCVGCPAAKDETVEGAAKVHRLELKGFLQDLNKSIKK